MEDGNEDLFLQSLDQKISEEQKMKLAEAMNTDRLLRKNTDQFVKLRAELLRKEEESFGPFFAERIINKIRSLKKEIDYQIFLFFRKYQLAAIGIVVALVVLNMLVLFGPTHRKIRG